VNDLQAATELFDRLLAEATGRRTPALRADEALRALAETGGDGLPDMRAAVARAIDLYADLFRETFTLYADVVELAVRGPRTTVAVELSGLPGAEAAAPVWIHNTTQAPLEAIALRITDLAAHDGSNVTAAVASFAPAEFDVPAGTSASATLAIAVPPAAAPGAYHGHVLAAGLPAVSVPVRLLVDEAA
jgi:hypothetical protein